MLVLTRKEGEAIRIGLDIMVRILAVKGKQVKIGIEAPGSVKILREELFESIKEENIAASSLERVKFDEAFRKLSREEAR